MSEEKQYLKDYIEQLNKKIKVYNELDNLIREFDNIDKSNYLTIKKENTKEKFNIFYNYYIILNNNTAIRDIIANSFNHSSVVIKEKLKNIEKEFQFDCIKNGLIFTIFEHINDIQNMYNILYNNTNKYDINQVKNFIDIYNNTDIYSEVNDIINDDLLLLKNRLKGLRDSIKMPGYRDNELTASMKLTDF